MSQTCCYYGNSTSHIDEQLMEQLKSNKEENRNTSCKLSKYIQSSPPRDFFVKQARRGAKFQAASLSPS